MGITASRRRVSVPADLPPEEAAIWRRLAPAAVRMGTLIPETVGGFRLLCEVAAERAATAAQIAAEGGRVQVDGAHPLLTHLRQLTQRQESLMSRFQVIAMGKPAHVPQAATAAGGAHAPHDYYGTARPLRRVK